MAVAVAEVVVLNVGKLVTWLGIAAVKVEGSAAEAAAAAMVGETLALTVGSQGILRESALKPLGEWEKMVE